MDISSEIVHGLLPVFLVTSLGASYSVVGFIQGVGESAAMVIKVFSGPLSDWIGKRKTIVFWGYALGALCKPLFALSSSSSMVLGARLLDRIGKGIRSAPRDALIADITPSTIRGRAFGLRQALDTVGGFLGPLLAIYLLAVFSGDYRKVFWIASIPGVMAAVLVLVAIREPDSKINRFGNKIGLKNWRLFSKNFWWIVGLGSLLQLARMSEAFLILRAQNVGVSLSLAPMVLVVMNVVYSLAAFPAGWLSDLLRRERLLELGLLVLFCADVILSLGSSVTSVFAGIVLWGLHLGLTQGVLTALIADHCPAEHMGTGFGIFNLMNAAGLLLGNSLAGAIWDLWGPQWTFGVSGIISIFVFLVFIFFRKTLSNC